MLTSKLLRDFYRGKRVFITGHTGFKGSWLSLMLLNAGANICGYSLAPEENPDSLYSLCNIDKDIDSRIGDIRDYESLYKTLADFKPNIVFHLAAQSLVLPSYDEPVATYATNVTGTLHLLEAIRKIGSVQAVVNVTTDKCYENDQSGRFFREDDKLGGLDPYSSSKAAAELVSSCYRASFLSSAGIHTATARAGNVIGGGDFSKNRLIPDIIRAAKTGSAVNLRHSRSVRPWQHVFDVLRGYLLLGKKLYEEGEKYAQAFNFGPGETAMTVGELSDLLLANLSNPPVVTSREEAGGYEAKLLGLNSEKAKEMLGWETIFSVEEAAKNTAKWYEIYLADIEEISNFTRKQLTEYQELS